MGSNTVNTSQTLSSNELEGETTLWRSVSLCLAAVFVSIIITPFRLFCQQKNHFFATKAIKRRYNLSKNCCLYKIMNMYYNIASSWGSCTCRSLLLGIGVCWSHSPIPSYRKPMLNVKIQFLRFLCTILCNFWQIMSILFFQKTQFISKREHYSSVSYSFS